MRAGAVPAKPVPGIVVAVVASAFAAIGALVAPASVHAQTAAEQPVSTAHLRTGPAYPTRHNVWSTRGLGIPAGGGWSSIKLLDINMDGYADLCGVYGPIPSLQNSYRYGCVLNVEQKTSDDPDARSFGGPLIRASAFDGAANESIHSTIATLDIYDEQGNRHRHLCGRSADGIRCHQFLPEERDAQGVLISSARFGAPRMMQASFSNAAGWNQPQYYTSISFVQLGDYPSVCARGINGVLCFPKWPGANQFSGTPVYTVAAFGDGYGWNQPKHYETVAFVDVNRDGSADVCGRGHAGIWCAVWLSDRVGFSAPTLWTTQYSDARGWQQPKHYQTIRYADVNGDGRVDVCGRDANGLICELSDGSRFLNAGVINQADFADVHGWTAPDHYRSITLVRVNADGRADVCGLNTQAGSSARQWLCALVLPPLTSSWDPPRFEAQLTVRTGDVNYINQLPVRGSIHNNRYSRGICWPNDGAVRCSNPWIW